MQSPYIAFSIRITALLRIHRHHSIYIQIKSLYIELTFIVTYNIIHILVSGSYCYDGHPAHRNFKNVILTTYLLSVVIRASTGILLGLSTHAWTFNCNMPWDSPYNNPPSWDECGTEAPGKEFLNAFTIKLELCLPSPYLMALETQDWSANEEFMRC